MRPVIGITCDEGSTDARPGRPASVRYELKRAYADAVFEAGGLPMLLPYLDADGVEELIDELDGVVVTGGAFDIPPEEYGDAAKEKLGALKPARTRFERRLMERALERGLPVLGVCGGMQLLNVVRGGTLVQDLATEVPHALEHEQPNDPREPGHEVTIDPGTRLRRLVGAEVMPANTTHHQAVAKVARDLVVCARAKDGVVEAIEGDRDTFVLGVQWHPELLADEANRRIYRGFIEAIHR